MADDDALLQAIGAVLKSELGEIRQRLDAMDEGALLKGILADHLAGLLLGIRKSAELVTERRAEVVERGEQPLPPALAEALK